jgi:hypothetical protein
MEGPSSQNGINKNIPGVDKYQATGIKPALMLLPPQAPARHVGAILLGGEQAFF